MVPSRKGSPHMRNVIFPVIVVLVPALSTAAPPDTLYYVGEVKLSSERGESMGSQVILLEKIHDRVQSMIVERAIVIQPDGKAEERTMRLIVKDDNTFTLTDEAKTIDGNGVLFGPRWA